jgi:hypothetical protein
VVHIYNPITHEAEVGGSQVLWEPVLYSEILSQTNKQTKQNKTKKPSKNSGCGLSIEYLLVF